MTIIPDLSDLVLEQVSITNEVNITVRAASATAPCPCCGIISKRIQSRYTRTLRDLPASGRPVHLILHVRRFFCQESACVRKIFALSFSFSHIASCQIHPALTRGAPRDGL
jgi:transposase